MVGRHTWRLGTVAPERALVTGRRRPGRRPGNRDTRAEIVAAARICFAEDGYDATSVRAIARRAGVDPALVHHYFDGKPALFVEVLHLARDPGEPLDLDGCPATPGAFAVMGFLSVWEPITDDTIGRETSDGDTSDRGSAGRDAAGTSPTNRFCTAMQAVTSSPEIADALREFLAARVWGHIPHLDGEDDETWKLRRSLVASQLVGMGMQRYVTRLEPLASATPLQLATWFGPSLTAAALGPLPEAP